jgi:hypothetical protein
MKNVVFWDIKAQFVPHRRHITSVLMSCNSWLLKQNSVFFLISKKEVELPSIPRRLASLLRNVQLPMEQVSRNSTHLTLWRNVPFSIRVCRCCVPSRSQRGAPLSWTYWDRVWPKAWTVLTPNILLPDDHDSPPVTQPAPRRSVIYPPTSGPIIPLNWLPVATRFEFSGTRTWDCRLCRASTPAAGKPGHLGHPAQRATRLLIGVRITRFALMLPSRFRIKFNSNAPPLNAIKLNLNKFRRMPSSGILRRVVLVRIDVSEEPSASIGC